MSDSNTEKPKREKVDSNSLEVLRLQMEIKNLEIRHEAQMNSKNMLHDFEKQRLQDKIQNLEAQLAILKEDDEEVVGIVNDMIGRSRSIAEELERQIVVFVLILFHAPFQPQQ